LHVADSLAELSGALDTLNGWRTGWTVGAGAEYALPRN
jgi:opacity protein-like surface antigen